MGSGGPRPGAGRRRKEPALKKLAGTERADRDAVPMPGADPATAPMICPLHLSELAQLHFGSIAKMLEEQQRANPHYAEHVALLALRLEQIQRYQAVIEVEGDTYESFTKTGRMIRARPEVTMLSDALRHAQSLLGELMLNPAAALRIASGHKPEAGAFDDF